MAKPTVWSAWLSISRCITNPAQVGMDVFGIQQLGRFRVALGEQCGNDLGRRVVDTTLGQSMSPLVDMTGSDFVGHSQTSPLISTW
jgi:hypothetical protein